MASHPIEYFLHLGGHRIPAREVRGHEVMSEPTRLEVWAFLPEGVSVDPDGVVRQAGAITLERDGVVRRIDLLATDVYMSHSVSGRPEVHAVLEANFAVAAFRSNIKIYRDMNALDIVSEVLGELGVPFALRASGSYPVRPYTVQWRETDLHFVSRMLEEEGLYYFFGDGGVMVIGDSSGGYDSFGSVPYFQPAGMERHDEAVWAMGHLAEASVSQVSLGDWCIDTPSLDLDVSATGPTPSGPEFYDFPGEYETPSAGQRIASLMAEAYACEANRVVGRSYAGVVGVGRRGTIEGAPEGVAADVVITRVEHAWKKSDEGFEVAFEGLPGETASRPKRVHEEPVLLGPLTGIVTGPPGADIHCDELGRVKVHFFWDRLLPEDDDCSHWVPVMQDNTGHSVSIPRVGWEVLVHFMEGDPDRPVVLGRVYNGEDLLPVLLPDHKTVTRLASRVSPSRIDSNIIELEDEKGSETIYVAAEKDQNIVVLNDRTERVGANLFAVVDHDETVVIGSNHTLQVGTQITHAIGRDQLIQVGGNQDHAVASMHSEEVQGNRILSIAGNHLRRVASEDKTQAKTQSEQVGAAVLEASVGGNAMTGGTGLSVMVGGALFEVAKGAKSEQASIARAETVGGVVFTKAEEQIQLNAGKRRVTTVGGALKIDAKGRIGLAGGEKLSTKSLKQEHDGTVELTLKVGESKVVLTEELIHITAPDTVTIQCEAENLLGSAEAHQNSGDGGGEGEAAE